MVRDVVITFARGFGALGTLLAPIFFGVAFYSMVQFFTGVASEITSVLLVISIVFVVWAYIGIHFAIHVAPSPWLYLASLFNAIVGIMFLTVSVEWPGPFIFAPICLMWSLFTFFLARRPANPGTRAAS